ncbi:MAG TPA: SpoIIE family protein phosphatase [Gemmataceae bacterium]|nr:SpoIIE family protein phosphatase [Gemmataceae bacterium]
MPPTDLTVRRLMTPDPYRLTPDRTVQDALDLMNGHRIGAVLISETDGKLVGIFTERDFLRRATAAPPGWRTIPVREWMSPYPYTVHPDAGWEEAVTSMERLGVRHLPVLENGQVVGIITARQLIARRAVHLNQVVDARTRELRAANDDLLARDAEINHYMKAAARLQKRLVLPQQPPDWPEIAWGVHYAPLEPLGGDFYDFARPDPDHLGVLIADASGHGLSAALVAVVARLAFLEAARESTRPGEVLAAMNARLQGMADERFVTAFYGVFDRSARTFTYANAGHPFPFRFAGGRAESLSARGFLLGVTPDERYAEKTVALAPGDRLVLFTDGVADCRDERGETFGTERIAASLARLADRPASGVIDGIVDDLKQYRGTARPVDDMTLVAAEIR